MGRRRGSAHTAAHPFYRGLNELPGEHGFDKFAEQRCEKFYAPLMGRRSLTPGSYFRRRLTGLETHREVFTWVPRLLAKQGLLKAGTIAAGATTLEANAALRSIVRRDSGESCDKFPRGLAAKSGIETPTREQLAKLDKKRQNKGSNKDGTNPHDPDAKITKMKDGRTHLAHKAEHAVDLETGALLALTVQGADLGDTATVAETITAPPPSRSPRWLRTARRTSNCLPKGCQKSWPTRAITATTC